MDDLAVVLGPSFGTPVRASGGTWSLHSLSCLYTNFAICLSHTVFPVCSGLLFVSVSLSVLSMFIVKFSRFAPWESPILGPWAL